ncbi:Utp14 protein-domain-containing protein [Aspergillus karnatakaensis]|uniref:UTP14 family protein n=1 Tax=Aspergillus karnatakaensis TaxID=1810916 RepID=UPI003CCE0B74
MPRQSTQLRSYRDEPAKNKKLPSTKRKSGKILNALSIAERENPLKIKVKRGRLGSNDDFKRKRHTARDDDDDEDEDSDGEGFGNKRRRTGDDDEELDSNAGSDGEGNRWKIGVDSDNDSELDSDEAMGESDEERFEGFTFRGSSTFKEKGKPKGSSVQKQRREREIDLSEGSVESDADEDMEDEEDDDDLGEDAIDLVAAWDMNVAEEEAEAKKAVKGKKRDQSESEDDSESEESESDDEKEGSDLSVTDDEVDEDGLSKLQSFVDSMNTTAATKPKKTKSGQEHLNPTEFGLTATRKLTVADLLPSVTDSRLKNSLKHVDSTVASQGTSTGIPGKLDAPLAKRQQDRLDRAAAYEKSKETLGRWIETVKANRRAEHLVFPLPDPDAQMKHRIGVIQPQAGLETEIQNILIESGLADAQGKSAEEQVQEFEELEARKLPIEEIRARRAELRKHRDLMFREEVRAKRIKKIKSKSFRRVHRKEQERMEQKERQALLEAGVDLEEQDRELNERRRAEARMGSKHKESKWAKSLKQTGRTAWDDDARHGAVELAQREEELRQRIEGKRVTTGEDDYLGSSSESEDENPWEEPDSDSEKRKILKKLSKLEDGDAVDEGIKGPHAKLLSMKFMQNADAARKAQNDAEIRRLNRELQGGEESASEAESEVGRRKFGHTDKKAEKNKGKKQNNRNEFEEAPGSDEERDLDAAEPKAAADNKSKPAQKAPEQAKALAKPKASAPAPAQDDSDAEEENPWLVASGNKNKRRSKTDTTDEPLDLTSTTAPAPSKPTPKPKSKPAPKAKASKKTPATDDTSDSDSDSDVPVLLKNHDLVKRAFAGDEVVADFEQEKLATIQDEGDRVVDEGLPGWGSWTGDGMSRKQKKIAQSQQRKNQVTVKGVKEENRKDYKLNKVIINEKKVRKNNKYLATSVPHEFENRQQYERSLRMPIGPEWTTKETFQSSTKPRVMIKQGVIKPMEKPMV